MVFVINAREPARHLAISSPFEVFGDLGVLLFVSRLALNEISKS